VFFSYEIVGMAGEIKFSSIDEIPVDFIQEGGEILFYRLINYF
jgi:hypothetical protein